MCIPHLSWETSKYTFYLVKEASDCLSFTGVCAGMCTRVLNCSGRVGLFVTPCAVTGAEMPLVLVQETPGHIHTLLPGELGRAAMLVPL